MKKLNVLTKYDAEFDEDGEKLPTPIKITQEGIKSREVVLMGHTFIDTGYALACPQCGKISGISCRKDIDEQIDWFLKFGCEHYEKSE